MSESIFFDTYSFIEVIRGNPKYLEYTSYNPVTTIFNVAELNYALKKEHSKKIADDITSSYRNCVTKLFWEDVISAMDLKTKHRNLSIPDALGFTVAKRLGMKFLTGDEDFKDFDNVVFVKK